MHPKLMVIYWYTVVKVDSGDIQFVLSYKPLQKLGTFSETTHQLSLKLWLQTVLVKALS